MNLRRTFNPVAAVALRAVRFAASRRLALSVIGQLTLVAVGVSYLSFGALRVNPFEDQLTVTVHLDESGGLLPSQDVTLRGIPVGRVQSVNVADDGVVVTARIAGHTRIPVADTLVRVSALSPAGEQYLDFAPQRGEGPYLTDGGVIERDRTETPVPL